MCDHLDSDHSVNSQKLTIFLLYCALRPQNPTKKTNIFCGAKFNALLSHMKNVREESDTEALLCNVENGLGYQAMRQYRYAVQELHTSQLEDDDSITPWNACFTRVPQNIIRICKKRKNIIKKRDDKEQQENVLKCYDFVDKVGTVVKWLNQVDMKAQTTPKRIYNVARVLAILTLTLFGVIRGETIFTANLSDLRFLKVKSPDPVPIELLLIMMNEGN